ncbi:aminodeoxychorismate/anthranilate synthase component II [Selenomonas sp.]|uniref:anthranilate synthase component II n=1 Tax=Selenomonas sp. TaxID=2053611 RepID=UPI001CB0D4C8|nr:aminodeoxychorismate/anthranilate synthase component II [Selenomonas sp.]MBF1694259.1 aminodeoxychorismate/anthranilate synthase component II [Selenomonas sp.]MBF1714241.1 aminodeoxychorismate/anthranilate synthase component II [Selenomonas sp.]
MLLLLDNYDSFTYNIYQLFSDIGAQVEVVRSDKISIDGIRANGYRGIIISPGPGIPQDAGISEEVIRQLGGEIPILGICLGHQAIGEVFGGRVVRAGEIVHGKASPIRHSGTGLYRDIPNPTEVARYHSLIIARENLPDVLNVTSQLDDGTIMGVRHKTLPIEGIQFHPESILTPEGRRMMQNYLTDIGAI